MNEYTCIEKIRDSHLNVTEYVLVDKCNNRIKVDRLGMKAMLSFKGGIVSNLKLTSDGRIINKTEENKEILDEEIKDHLNILARTLYIKNNIIVRYEMMYERNTDNKVYVITDSYNTILLTLILTEENDYYSVSLDTTINNVKYNKSFDFNTKSGLDKRKLKDFSNMLYKLILKMYNIV